METIEQHWNKPQLKSLLIDAPNETFIAGRGTGKTVKVGARKTAINYLDSMPRGKHIFVAATFTQSFTRTLPELIKGWGELGYVLGHHFIVGEKPTEKWKNMWKWKGPYSPPMDFKYIISWWNGSVAQLVSQERRGQSNGMSIDSIFGDEAKLLNDEKFQTELLPANRGIIPAFKGNPNHHGITLISDMPVGTGGRWLLNMESSMDKAVVNQIWEIQTACFILRNELLPKANAAGKKEIEKQLAVFNAELKDLRKGLLYYHEASSLENIHALGVDYIKQQLAVSTQFQFDTQILNIRPLRLEDGFYPELDEEYHGYFSENASFFDNTFIDVLNPLMDSRKDGDVDPDASLHIAIDYNRRIHPIVIAQINSKEIRFVNNLHAEYPGKLKEAVNKFIAYYKHHKKKVVYYWFDHTAVGDDNDTRKCDDVVGLLEQAGWVVISQYYGLAPGHETKYRMWGDLLSEDGKYQLKARFNRENSKHLLLSMGLAGAEQKKDGFGKDKSTEKDPKFPAVESTHYSDAGDQLVYGILESGLDYTVANTPVSSIITK